MSLNTAYSSTPSRTWTEDEKQKCVELIRNYHRARKTSPGETQIKGKKPEYLWREEILEEYLLNKDKTGLRFVVEPDGNPEVDDIHRGWSYLAKLIKTYGTADQDLIKHIKSKNKGSEAQEHELNKQLKAQEHEFNKQSKTQRNELKHPAESAQGNIGTLNMKMQKCERFLINYPQEHAKLYMYIQRLFRVGN